MKDPQEYLTLLNFPAYQDSLKVEGLLEVIKDAQIDAYNEALVDALENGQVTIFETIDPDSIINLKKS